MLQYQGDIEPLVTCVIFFLNTRCEYKGLPGKQRLEVSYQLLLSWKDLVRECLGLLYNFLEHKHSAHETACA